MKKIVFICILILSCIFLPGCVQKQIKNIEQPSSKFQLSNNGDIINCADIPHWFYTDNREVLIDESNYKLKTDVSMPFDLQQIHDSYLTTKDGTVYSLYYEGVSVDKLVFPETNGDIIIEIPEMINDKKVIKLGGSCEISNKGTKFSPATHLPYLDKVFLFGSPKIKTIKIPKFLKEISFGNFYGLKVDNAYYFPIEKILVDEDNSYYSAIDGVLFDKNQKTLLFYPELKKDNEYIVPKTVKTIEFMDFSNTKIKSIVMGKNIENIKAVFNKDILIKGYENTYVQQWAVQNGYNFESI